MLGTSAIRNLIREDKVAQMYSSIQTGGSLGMQTLDMCLKELVTKGVISREHAREKARSPDNFFECLKSKRSQPSAAPTREYAFPCRSCRRLRSLDLALNN